MRHVVIGVLLGSVYLWAYAGVRSAGYVYEDDHWVAAPACCPSVTLATFAAQDGASPRSHHLLNIALHAAVAALVGLWARRLGVSASGAWVAVALMLWHPMAVEAAAYVAGRAELVTALLVMAACGLMVGGGWALAAGLTFGLAAGYGKVTGLAVVALVPLTLVGRGQVRRAIVVLVLLVVGAVALWAGRVEEVFGWSTPSVGAIAWFYLQATAAVRLIGMTVVPVGQSVVFDVELVPVAAQAMAAMWLVVLGGFAWMVRGRWPLVAIGIVWMMIVIAPRLIVQLPDHVFQTAGTAFGERHLYLALPGAALIAGTLWDGGRRRIG